MRFEYNAEGQLTLVERYTGLPTSSPVLVGSSVYEYNHPAGWLTEITHRKANEQTITAYGYAYEESGRLASQTLTSGGQTATRNYDYDETDQLTGVTNASAQTLEDYEYDATGNRTGSHLSAGYQTDHHNRLVDDGTYTYTYDGEGNLASRTRTSDGQFTEYHFDHRNRLTAVVTKVTSAGAETKRVEYLYDQADRRVARIVDADGAGEDVYTHYLFDDRASVVLELADADGADSAPADVTHRYLHGAAVDEVLSDEADSGGGTQFRWALSDHQGSVRDLAAHRRDEGRMAEAIRELQIAIDAIEKLIASGDEIDRGDIAVHLYLEQSAFLTMYGQHEAALQSVERGVEIAQVLVEKLPNDLALRLMQIRSQAMLARRLADAGRLDDARAVHEAALSAAEKTLAATPKDPFVRDAIAHALSDLAHGWPARAAIDLCEALHRRSLALRTGLAEELPGDPWHAEFAGHECNDLGRIAGRAGRLDEACAWYERAAAVFARLAAADTFQRGGLYRDFHGISLTHLADVLAMEDRFADAETAAQQCAQTYNALVDEFPHNAAYQVKMARAGNRHALLLIKRGDLEAYRHVCRGFCERVNENSSAEARHFVARTCALAHDAVADWNVPLAQARQLVEQEPENAEFLAALGSLLYRAARFDDAVATLEKPAELALDRSPCAGFVLAMAHWQLSHKDEARQWYERSDEWMEKNQPTNEELACFRAEAEQLLSVSRGDSAIRP